MQTGGRRRLFSRAAVHDAGRSPRRASAPALAWPPGLCQPLTAPFDSTPPSSPVSPGQASAVYVSDRVQVHAWEAAAPALPMADGPCGTSWPTGVNLLNFSVGSGGKLMRDIGSYRRELLEVMELDYIQYRTATAPRPRRASKHNHHQYPMHGRLSP